MAKKVPTTTKQVYNRNIYKIELVSDGKVYVFPPRKYTAVPNSVNIPAHRGLIVKE